MSNNLLNPTNPLSPLNPLSPIWNDDDEPTRPDPPKNLTIKEAKPYVEGQGQSHGIDPFIVFVFAMIILVILAYLSTRKK